MMHEWTGPIQQRCRGALVAAGALLLAAPAGAVIEVSDLDAVAIKSFNESSGAFVGNFAAGAPLTEPGGLTYGPDGRLYVADGPQVRRFAPDGTHLGVFASGGGLGPAFDVTFGPDGNLYVMDDSTVYRYDGSSGAFIGAFADVSGLAGPVFFVFGPGGDLYVADGIDGEVVRYDGTTGASLGTFVSLGLSNPLGGIDFGPDGNFYVADALGASVLRYTPAGALIGTFVTGVLLPQEIRFGPDGDLYVVRAFPPVVQRFDGSSGALVGNAAAGGGLSLPTSLAFRPEASPGVPALPPGAALLLALLLGGAARGALRAARR